VSPLCFSPALSLPSDPVLADNMLRNFINLIKSSYQRVSRVGNSNEMIGSGQFRLRSRFIERIDGKIFILLGFEGPKAAIWTNCIRKGGRYIEDGTISQNQDLK
jgi:hypothetical protein